MSEPHETPVRRILVAMDLSMHGSAALEAAARLATEMRAELQGLFVEDIDLFRLATLPFALEIDYSGILRPLNLEALEQTLRRKADEVRRAIAETAQRTSLHWSFRITRGKFIQTMLTESLQADLLLIAREESLPVRSPLMMRRGPIIAVEDGAPPDERLFSAAQCLARQYADTIVVLVRGEDESLTGQYAIIQPDRYIQRCSQNVESLLQVIRTWRPQLVLIRRSSPLAEGATVDTLLRQLPCPLVFVQ